MNHRLIPSRPVSRRRLSLVLLPVVFAASGRCSTAPVRSAPPSAEADRPAGAVTGRVQNQATGQYLNNARISLRGTSLVVFTDEFGVYRISRVPPGSSVIDVFYTGLDPAEIKVDLTQGQTLELNIGLNNVSRYGGDANIVKLDTFVVESARDTEGDALATNEQRFAANIKNVVATDALGDIMGNSVGEFLKFLPGVTAEYTDVEITGISVRGVGGALTNFSTDGAPTANASTSSTRSVWLVGVDLTSASRIEVTKVPTPATPADSLAGSVNLVSKSAFERRTAQFRYGMNLKGNSKNLDLKKTPHPYEKTTWKLRPGLDFDYTLPMSKTMGIVVTGMHSDVFQEQPVSAMIFNAVAAGTGASPRAPFLQSHSLSDGPRSHQQSSGSVKFDWRVTPNGVLSVGYRGTYYKTYIGSLALTTGTGTAPTPTPANLAGAVPLSYGDDYTIGATARGSVTLGSSYQTLRGVANSGNLQYRFDDGTWRAEVGGSRTESRRYRRNNEPGHFATMSIAMLNPVRVSYSDIARDRPGATQVWNNANQEVDIYNLENYRLTSAGTNPYTNRAGAESGYLNIRRGLGFLPIPSSLQIGAMQSAQTRDTKLESATWNYHGLDGNPATIEPPTPFAAQIYNHREFGFGYKNLPWVSPHRMYRAWKENPNLFSQTPAQAVAEERFRITNSEYIEEVVSAFYFQCEGRLLKNRLRLLTGVRYEETELEGLGPLNDPEAVWQRDARGNFLRNAAGQRLRKSEAGAIGSMEELRLTFQERGYRADRSYDGYYPSLHATFSARENLLIRAAYARTYGRPNFVNIIPSTTFNEADLRDDELEDPDAVKGTIRLRNTGLKPWTAHNYDLSIEYYGDRDGLYTAGVFVKEIQDFFADDVRIATPADLDLLGLDSRYLGWSVSTKFNSGNARIAGAEINLRHSLRALGSWGQYFIVFANGTKLKLDGNAQSDFTAFSRDTANWGVTFKRKRVTVMARWNYRGLNRQNAQPALGPDAYQYDEPRVILDMNLTYQLSPRLSLSASVGNVPLILREDYLPHHEIKANKSRSKTYSPAGGCR